VIVVDTHIWLWWVQGSPKLSAEKSEIIENNVDEGILLSDVSLWEVAKLVQLGRIVLPVPIAEWMHWPSLTPESESSR